MISPTMFQAVLEPRKASTAPIFRECIVFTVEVLSEVYLSKAMSIWRRDDRLLKKCLVTLILMYKESRLKQAIKGQTTTR